MIILSMCICSPRWGPAKSINIKMRQMITCTFTLARATEATLFIVSHLVPLLWDRKTLTMRAHFTLGKKACHETVIQKLINNSGGKHKEKS